MNRDQELQENAAQPRARVARWFHIQPTWIDFGVVPSDEMQIDDSATRCE
jgi:hypothetical protein